MIGPQPITSHQPEPAPTAMCAHRTVSKDGRIVCAKIVQGDNTVSPATCLACPARTANCSHLRFALSHSSPSPLVVRFNGRTEVWHDDSPSLAFQQAACAARVAPVHHPRACAACPLRLPLSPAADPTPSCRPSLHGKVVPFPSRDPLAATG